jgi:hypothetical protein
MPPSPPPKAPPPSSGLSCGCLLLFFAAWLIVPVYFLGLMGVPIWAAVLLAYFLFWR